ncbi:ATP-binding protein [Lamprobacter modestohalophilus]|uniref:ATP-binding protein n=1 Tax=Lamprobacter modestohalophilus TaxID=1064514 RepID=UPI002ADEB78F|nr:ATP-binding protein [Lamprobacter modestohalophilus]MEA1053142.1 ATP-binding protein [Lamprobacter modestohalophilus]
MLDRRLTAILYQRLEQFPAVALLGPRQVGKTTLAYAIGDQRPSLYLDLESPPDRDKLSDPVDYLSSHADQLVILDEIQRVPALFQSLRGLIDQGRRQGRTAGQFLLLGSASIDLLAQSSETLAGRIAYVELAPFDVLEVAAESSETLWVRGGLPESFLARSERASMIWREQFIRTYLERDIPQFDARTPAETLRRLWTMLAHHQGGLLNTAQLARGLALDGRTVNRYLDLLVDLLLVRRLAPYHVNVGKRLVRSPKLYIRDAGLVHALLRLPHREALLGHPVVGASWEGFVIENLIGCAPDGTQASFYRTAVGAEIDLLLALPNGETWAVEIKRGLAPTPDRGFHQALEDLRPDQAWIVYSGEERYRKPGGITVIGLRELCSTLQACA